MKHFCLYKPESEDIFNAENPPSEIEVEDSSFLDEVEDGEEIAVLVKESNGQQYCLVGNVEIRSEGTFRNGDPKVSFWIV